MKQEQPQPQYNQQEMESDLLAKKSLDDGGHTRVKLYNNGLLVLKKGGSMHGEEEAIAQGEGYDPSEDMHIEIDPQPALALLNFLLDHRYELYDLAQGPTPQEQWFAQQLTEWEQKGLFPPEMISRLRQQTLNTHHLELVESDFVDEDADTRWAKRVTIPPYDHGA